jgi:acetolactate synthase-1/2/3 large subunit
MTVTGAELLCRVLEHHGAGTVFGLPGTQNVPLFEALRRSALRTVQATTELNAVMMAAGWARASGRVGVVAAIPGPGLAWAFAGLAEALHDSTPILLVTGTAATAPGRAFQLQAFDQRTSLGPVVKGVLRADEPGAVEAVTLDALQLALEGEPGPVVLELSPGAQTGTAAASGVVPPARAHQPAPGAVATLLARLEGSCRPMLLAGQGAQGGAEALRLLAERLQAPVITSLSGRGVLPEDHPLSLGVDLGLAVDRVNAMAAESDLVLALGWKGSHNGTGGFGLRLPADRLVHVDASTAVIGANYPVSAGIVGDVPSLLAGLAAAPLVARPAPGWAAAMLGAGRGGGGLPAEPEPRFAGLDIDSPARFFVALRQALPRNAILLTDSGLHQALARRYFPVHAPRGFLAPSDFQSMGFGIPAAIGAALAAPGRRVAVVSGDGGFAMVGMELLTAAREGVRLAVIVFNDGHLGLIRRQQAREYGHTHAVAVGPVDYAAAARALGVGYRLLAGDAREGLAAALAEPGPVLVEVVLGDTPAFDLARARSAVREGARRALPAGVLGWLRRRLG